MTVVKGAEERKKFYGTAINILFAIVVGHSFLMASDFMIPVWTMFEPDNYVAASTLIFAYILIVSGWIGYSRSISVKPHRDTGWGVARFVLDLVIMFEYFYLLRIVQTNHITDFPVVLLIIFVTYIISDSVKMREYPPTSRVSIKQRSKITNNMFGMVVLAIIGYYAGFLSHIASTIGMDAHVLSIVVFTGLVLLYRGLKWDLKRRPLKKNIIV